MAPNNSQMDERQPLLADRTEKKPHYNLIGLTPFSFWVLFLSICLSAFLVALDGTIVATLAGPISSEFEATELASWLGTSYLLSVCCVTPLYGRLCNIIGRRNSVLIATSIFALGNILCACAPSMKFLIAARCIAGLGGGGIQTITSTVVSDIVPLSHRALFQGYMNILFGAGGGLGGPIGGLFADNLSWRLAFWVQIPVFVIALLAAYFKIRYPMPPTAKAIASHPWEALKRVDFLGSLLLAGWLASPLTAISMKAESTDVNLKWTSPIILTLFGIGAATFIVFLIVELRIAKEPVLPVELLHKRTPIACFVSNLTLSMVMFGNLYAVPLFYTAVREMSPSRAGAHLVPYSVTGMCASVSMGWYVRHYGKYYWLLCFAGVFGIISSIMLAGWDEHTPGWQLWIALPVSSLAGSGITGLSVVALIASVNREGIATATSLSYVARTTGQVLGVALSGALEQTILQKELSKRITGHGSEEIIADIRHSSALIRTLPPHLKEAAIASWQKALHAVFVCTIVLGVIYVLAGLCVEDHDLSTAHAPVKAAVDEESTQPEDEA